jgi:hypothetical protein
MSFNLNSLWLDWRAKVPDGTPNPDNAYHLVLLKELCFKQGIDREIIDNVILVLEKDEKIDPETIVKYKDEDGEEKEAQYSYASKQPEGTPAKTAADRLKGSDGDDEEKDVTKLSGDELSTDTYADKALSSKGDDEVTKGGEEDKEDYKIEVSDDGMEAYEHLSNLEAGNVELKPPDFGGKDAEVQRRVVAQRLFAKLQLLSNGKDVEFTDADKANLQYLTISSKPISGKVYFGERTDTMSGHPTIPQGASIGKGDKRVSYGKKFDKAYNERAQNKQAIYERWPALKKKLDALGITPPKFKSPLGKIDDPPKSLISGHLSLSHKPNKMIKTRTKVSDLHPQIKKTLLESGMKEEDTMLGGPIGDPNKPPPETQDFVDSNMALMDEILESTKSAGSEESQEYVKTAHDRINAILTDPTLTPEQRLQKLEKNLGKIQKEMYDTAGKLDENEQASVLKDFGEVIVTMKYRCQEKEAYMPSSGNYPIADVLVIERDGAGKVISINSVSVKSADKGTNIPGSSAAEFCKHFAKVYPKHKETFGQLEEMQVNRIGNLKKDKLDEQTKKDVETIESFNKVCDDDATFDQLYDDINNSKLISDSDLEKIKKSMAAYIEQAGLQPETPKVYSKVLMEMTYRKYTQKKTKETMDNLDLELGIQYAEVRNVNGELEVEELEGEHHTSNMQIHDKGYLGTPDSTQQSECEDGTSNVSDAKYQKANTALKYKEAKG